MRRRWLVQALMASGVLNAVLMALLFIVMVKERSLHAVLPYRPQTWHQIAPPLDQQAYEALKQQPYEALLSLLNDRTALRAGYRMRDVALGILVTRYDLDVTRALGHTVESKSFLHDGAVFVLRERDYKRLLRFIQEQQAPFTTYGLYRRLPKTADAFCMTPEYLQFYTLIHRLNPACCQRPTVLALCRESGWSLLTQFCAEQKEAGEWSSSRAYRLLVDIVHRGGRTAAYLLVINSPQHALQELDDRTVAAIVTLLNVRTQEAVACCQELVHSSRPFSVREQARLFLYQKQEIKS